MDYAILNYIQNLRTPLLDTVMTYITKLGDSGILWIVLSILLLFFKKTRKSGAASALALIAGTVIFTVIVKNIIARTRPYDGENALLQAAQLIIPPPGDYSFPSGHSMASFAAAVSILLNNRKIGIGALIAAFLIAFSRLYLYVHFPSDVICGIIFGTASAFFSNFIVNKIIKLHEKKKASQKNEVSGK